MGCGNARADEVDENAKMRSRNKNEDLFTDMSQYLKDKINSNILPVKSNNKTKYFERYDEQDEIKEESKTIENDDDRREKEYVERGNFIARLKFTNIFKDNNIDRIHTSLYSDRKQKVKTIFIQKQKFLPKISKFLNPIQNVPGPFWELKIEASKNELMYPLWIEKGKEVTFFVHGTWFVNKNIECDCNGIPQTDIESTKFTGKEKFKFNTGALVGRLIRGEEFQLYDGLKFTSENNGPLMLRMNLNSLFPRENPWGALSVKVKGAAYVNNILDMEERIGWWRQLKVIELNNLVAIPQYNIPSIEKMLIILFNKARYNSKLFALHYLYNIKDLAPKSNQIYDEVYNNINQNVSFKINVSIVKLLQNFFSPYISGVKNSMKNSNDSLIILKSEKILKNYLEECFNHEKKIFNITIIKYKEKNPYNLIVKLLFDKKIRDTIFKSNCEEMSMITMQLKDDLQNIIYYTVIVFSDENGNENLNYDIAKHVNSFINKEKKFSNDNNIVCNIKINLKPNPNIISSENHYFFQFN